MVLRLLWQFITSQKMEQPNGVIYFTLTMFGVGCVLGQQLSCEGDFTIPRFASGARFVTAIADKSYDCACRGENCQQITCLVLQSTSEELPTTQTCTDQTTGRIYARGTTFIRYGQDGANLACTCPSTGSLKIECKSPQCVIPPPPPPTRSHFRNTTDSCYDRHTDNWHPYDVPYTRKVIMSYAPDIIGEYRCICARFSTRCTAVDMPCCDTRIGRFVAKNERFTTAASGLLPMSCVCLGGRGRIGQCEQLHDRREIGQSRRIRKKRCLDSTTNRYYREGATFIQIRNTGERRCICKRQQRKLKIVCTRRNSPPTQ